MSGSLAGGNFPGWTPGYVPTADEWNEWWSRKFDIGGDIALVGGPWLPSVGGSVTGPIILPPEMPVDPREAVSKEYVDSLTFATGPFMPQTGGTFTGPVAFNATVTLAAAPATTLEAATKGYVDASTAIGNNALTVANAAVRRSGDTMTGFLTLSAHPTSPFHATTKTYADGKLSLAGGTITGTFATGPTADFQAGRDVFVAGGLYVGGYGGWEYSLRTDGAGNHFVNYRSTWYDVWESSGGARRWVGANNNLMVLDAGGNLNVRGFVNAGADIAGVNITASGNGTIIGNLTVGASLASASLTLAGGWTFYNGGNHIQQHTANWYDEWRVSDGNRAWVNGGAVAMSLSPAGALRVNNQISGTSAVIDGQIVAGSSLAIEGGSVFLGVSGAQRILQFQTNWYLGWNSSNGDCYWVADRSPAARFWTMRTSDVMCFNELGPVGGTSFVTTSDERTKEDITPAVVGLDEVLQVTPIEFTRYDGNKRELGFSAQQLQRVMPIAVTPIGSPLPAGGGRLEDDSPTLGVNTLPLVAALFNAVKTLSAEITSLKAAR